MSQLATTAAPTGATGVAARRRSAPRGLLVASLVVVAILACPLAFLLIEASGSGVAATWHLAWRSFTASLLWNTVRLCAVVTALSAVIGTMCAWCVERTDLPGRRVFAVLLVVPFAVPDFVIAFGWGSLWTWVHGFDGAVLVMTLGLYPLVYLPVAASLRGADPGQEEAARSLGAGRLETFVRVTLGQARGAILGGCVLVALVLLAEYGAFEILGYQTFTTEIFTEFTYSIPTACALSIVLICVCVAILAVEQAARGRARIVRSGQFAQRVRRRHRLGPCTLPVVAALLALSAAALGVPIASCIYWMTQGTAVAIEGTSLASAGMYTALFSASAALVTTLMALPVAVLAVRHDSTVARLLERSSYIVLSMPGLVIALALSYFSERYVDGFAYQTAPMLVCAYVILFFPLALVGVKASVAYAPVGLDEAARSLGASRWTVLRRVTLPLVGPGLAASFCLVFLAAVTELTATLVLIPTGIETLATQFWAYQGDYANGQAAPFALVIIAVAAVPSYVLARFFDRLPARAAGVQ